MDLFRVRCPAPTVVPDRDWFYLCLKQKIKKASPEIGESGGRHRPSPQPSTLWLTWPPVWGGPAGEGLLPGARAEETRGLCVCSLLRHLFSLLPACGRPPSRLACVRPCLPHGPGSQSGLLPAWGWEALPAPAWPCRPPSTITLLLTQLLIFRRVGRDRRAEAAKAFSAHLANLQLVLAILYPIPRPAAPPPTPCPTAAWERSRLPVPGSLGFPTPGSPDTSHAYQCTPKPMLPMLPHTIHSQTRLPGAPSYPVFEHQLPSLAKSQCSRSLVRDRISEMPLETPMGPWEMWRGLPLQPSP